MTARSMGPPALSWIAVGLCALAAAGCRAEAERSALAQVPGATATAPDVADGRPAEGPEPRRLWVGENVAFYEMEISPDGRFVTEQDETSGDLAVRDLATRTLHRLTDKGSWDDSIDYFQSARFSPDGRRILYTWYDNATAGYEIRVLDFSFDDEGRPIGSGNRVVYPAGVPEGATIVYGWLSDDEALIGLRRPDDTRALAVVSLMTGETRPLKSFGWGEYPGRTVVSPDGRYVAYGRRSGSDTGASDLYVMTVDGTADMRLVSGAGRDVPLAWVPDGSAVLFHRWGDGNGSIWRVPVSEGRQAGPAVEVLGNVPDPTPIGLGGDAFHYGLVVERPAVVTATIDADAGRLTPLATRFDPPTGGRTRTFAWAPDGRHVLEEIDYHGEPDTWIRLRTEDGELVEDWTFDLFIMFTHFRFAPDGRSAIVPANDALERPGFMRIDLDRGEASMLVQFDRGGEFGRVSDFSPDGERLYYTRKQFDDGPRDEAATYLVERVLATGAERRLARVRDHGAVTASPDGEWLAIALPPRSGPKMIRVVPTADGEARTVYESGTEMSRFPTVLGWTEDAGSLLFLDQHPSDAESAVGLFRVSIHGGDADRLATIEGFQGLANLHPDGRTLAYRTGEQRGEIWALDLSEAVEAPAATGGGR
ncbi:MAG: hypothetical protein R3195_05255 [Gemmatimonadota bacterium]|nr:hypothetical protein [Gemmatimonadota bacterium]